ncbi:nuclear transport factor 2 family protein [Novosphingobium beihaiensis]|uniref:Nuclear transport factor 2 family protein n=1 Tax=Novosphingobium beihaiensis TaxID=2930389 RepID=A0ABT0BPA0_9SPHN|nr:nuclear transport factor 2 family protein [Novosphingobium beihaiensis]MCJ2186803.1 nuclear transport factor 2 family protein [Novosphingobium beihaiensis]
MDLENFAARWIEDWNSGDIERILAHYAEDAEFRSPHAVALVGSGAVRGREALRNYWGPALEQRPKLRFHLKKAFIGHRTVAIHYGDELGRDVVETLVLNESGLAVFGCGCYA